LVRTVHGVGSVVGAIDHRRAIGDGGGIDHGLALTGLLVANLALADETIRVLLTSGPRKIAVRKWAAAKQ
jgi:hypothetical protein